MPATRRARDPFATSGTGDRRDTAEILRRLEFVITHRLDGLLHGDHLGLVPGHGSDLGETRAYVAGDDVRRIDWNVTARMQHPHIRTTIADRELETWVVVDRSASLEFGTAMCTKADLATSAMAAMGFVTAHTGNRFGAMLLDPQGETVVPARGGRDHLMRILHLLVRDDTEDGGAVDLAGALKKLSAIVRRRGLVVVVSDFLTDEAWEQPLRMLATRHEVLAIEVVDPRELELPEVGTLTLVDPESGRAQRIDTSSAALRSRYAAAAAEQRAAIAERFRRAGVEHLLLRTDRDWVRDFVRYVAARRQKATGAGPKRITR